MFNSTFKWLLMGVLLLLSTVLPAANDVAIPSPNLYEFKGNNNLSISYATTGIDGKPHFTYQDAKHTLSFAGDQIRTVGTEIGTLVSVTVFMTVDNGSTSFSVLVPDVKLDQTLESPVKTEGIVTKHKFSVVPGFNNGQTDNYKFYSLTGKAKFVVF